MRSRLGRDWTNRNVCEQEKSQFCHMESHDEGRLTFSLQMVWMTSSGGVPNNSVMMENWLTSEDSASQYGLLQ